MSDSKGVITLKDIVLNVQNDIGPQADAGNYFRFLQFAIRGMKKLRLFDLNIVNTARLDMSDINTVTLPDDYVNFCALGVPYKGRMWTFTKEGKMISPSSESCGKEVLDSDKGEGIDISDGYNVSGYGVPGGGNLYYMNIELKNNRIVLSGFNRTTVILKYISTGVSMNDETYIPRIAEEALIAWVHWKRLQYDRKSSRVDKYSAKVDYYEAVKDLRDVQSPTLDEIYDAIYETFFQSAKR